MMTFILYVKGVICRFANGLCIHGILSVTLTCDVLYILCPSGSRFAEVSCK